MTNVWQEMLFWAPQQETRPGAARDALKVATAFGACSGQSLEMRATNRSDSMLPSDMSTLVSGLTAVTEQFRPSNSKIARIDFAHALFTARELRDTAASLAHTLCVAIAQLEENDDVDTTLWIEHGCGSAEHMIADCSAGGTKWAVNTIALFGRRVGESISRGVDGSAASVADAASHLADALGATIALYVQASTMLGGAAVIARTKTDMHPSNSLNFDDLLMKVGATH